MEKIRIGIVLFLPVFALVGCSGSPNDSYACGPCSTYPKPDETRSCPDIKPPDAPYRNLVLQGGGVKGIAYGGALTVLNEAGLIQPIERVGGTSAGAIIATLLALGYNACAVSEYVEFFDYTSFRDGGILGDGRRLIREYGMYKGDDFNCTMHCVVKHRLPDAGSDPNFLDLEQKRVTDPSYKSLYVVATDLSTENPVVFSHESEFKTVPIADAVRKSMSIPFFFRSRTLNPDFHEFEKEPHIFADGGVVWNYPIQIFDGDDSDVGSASCFRGKGGESCLVNGETLGLHLSEGRKAYKPIDDLIGYASQVYHSAMAVQTDSLCKTPDDVIRTIFIDTFGISATHLDISLDQRKALVASGAKHAGEFLSSRRLSTRCPPFILPEPE